MTDKQQLQQAGEQSLAESGASGVMHAIMRAVDNPNLDPDRIERFLDIYKDMEDRENEKVFNRSLTACQKDMRRISADAVNTQTSSRYATYAALDRALRPIYTNHGFGVSFDTEPATHQEEVRVVAYVSHESGFVRKYSVDMPADGKGAKGNAVMTRTHATGAAMSYGMRYLLKMIFNVAVGEDDDDGNSAGTMVDDEPITEEQANTLQALLDETGANEHNFLQAAGLKPLEGATVRDLPARKYEAAYKRLKDRYDRQQKEQQE